MPKIGEPSTLIECLSTLIERPLNAPSLWMRPVHWVGRGEAFCLETDGHVAKVPSPKGAVRGMTTHAPTIVSAWELVDPETVNGGQ